MTRRIADVASHGEVEVRRWRPEDGDELRAVILTSDAHLRPRMAWLDLWAPVDCDPAATIIGWNAEWDDGGDLYAGIFERGTIAGAVGLHRRIGPTGLEVGYWLGAHATGRGLATIASGLATDLAFVDPTIDHVRIAHDVTNTASEGVPRRLGYARIGEIACERQLGPADTGTDRIWEVTRVAWPGYASLA